MQVHSRSASERIGRVLVFAVWLTLQEEVARQAALSGDSRMAPKSMPARELRRCAERGLLRAPRALLSELALSGAAARGRGSNRRFCAIGVCPQCTLQ